MIFNKHLGKFFLVPIVFPLLFSFAIALLIPGFTKEEKKDPKNLITHQQAYQMLVDNWNAYKEKFIQKDGRVIDINRKGLSTSEGQAYAMLRAVWMRDREIFDLTYKWAIENLRKRGDHLYAWHWGEREDGSWGIIDKTAATDADQDIALALLMAWKIWDEEQYHEDALDLLDDIWDKETIKTDYGRTLMAGDWNPKELENIQLNPSYFAPYAYRVFDEEDRWHHDWDDIIDSSYEILDEATDLTRHGLSPDWIQYSPKTEKLTLYDTDETRSDYGYEAIRTNWRLVLDHLLYPKDKRSKRIIRKSDYLPRYWSIHSELPGPLTSSGISRQKIGSPSIYGTEIGAIALTDPEVAYYIIKHVFLERYEDNLWHPQHEYYSQNWLWFGLAQFNYYAYGRKNQRRRDSVLKKLIDFTAPPESESSK